VLCCHHTRSCSVCHSQWMHESNAHVSVAQPFASDECALSSQGSCNVSAGGSGSLDEDIIDILPRLLSSSPLRMLCLQHTGAFPGLCLRPISSRMLQSCVDTVCGRKPRFIKLAAAIVVLIIL
jgi:hypothetical protein